VTPLWGKSFDELTVTERDREFDRIVEVYDLDLAARRRLLADVDRHRDVVTAVFNLDWITADELMREYEK
jgi:hypothetical protein